MLTDLGLDQATILTKAGLPSGLLHGEGSTIPVLDFFTFWQVISDEIDDPSLPLKLADLSAMDYFDPAFFAAMCSPNLNIAAARLSEFKSQVGPFGLDVTIKERDTSIVFFCKGYFEIPTSISLIELVFLVNFARRATRHNIVPTTVSLPSDFANPEIYERHFGCPIHIGKTASICFSAADAQRPFLTHDDDMWLFFEPQLRKRMDEAQASPSTRARVEHVLVEYLPSGRATMAEVAHDLAMSKRTLQRRLSEENTTWQQVLNDARKSLAKHYLVRTELGMVELSLLLCFEDLHSLYRAFRRWEGTSPEAWRTRFTEGAAAQSST